MSYIIDMLKNSKEKESEVIIVTTEGQQSYRIVGIVEDLNNEDVLIKRTDKREKKKLALKINNIIKVED